MTREVGLANQGGGGNGHSGGDPIVMLHSAVVHLRDSLDRHQVETQENLRRMAEASSRHHRETMGDISQITEILAAVGSKLKDHEHRLAALETKVL